MRVDPVSTAIHDLTDDEAAELRAVCESMLFGSGMMGHPLFIQWCDAANPARSISATMMSIVFLPRALHALLLRAERS